MEIKNLLSYRFSTLGEFIGLQQTNNIPPKAAPRKYFMLRNITTKQTNVLIDNVLTSKPLCPSKILAWAIKDGKATLEEPLCYLIKQFILEVKFPEDPKKACVTPLFKNGIPKTHPIIDLTLSLLLCQKFLKKRSIHKSQFPGKVAIIVCWSIWL